MSSRRRAAVSFLGFILAGPMNLPSQSQRRIATSSRLGLGPREVRRLQRRPVVDSSLSDR